MSERITLTLPKGYKEKILAEAERNGESVDAYIGRLLLEGLERLSAESNHRTEQE